VLAVVTAYFIVGGAKQSSLGNDDSNETNNNNTTNPRISFETLTSDGSPVQGDPSARITLVEFGDFQCEFCARFAKETEPQIYQNYVQTGKVNMVFKHLVHYGSDSDLAASASQCANDQGKFWDYYHILYTDQDSFMLSKDTASALKNLASKINGLNLQKFDSCLDGGVYKDIAKKDTKLADSLGFRDTPTFLIVKSDGSSPQTLVGAYPFTTFKGLLDKEIGGA
jgi:protein-disulfide isomerase